MKQLRRREQQRLRRVHGQFLNARKCDQTAASLSWRPFRSVNVVNERQMRELLARWPDSTHHWSAIAGLRAPATAAMLGDPIAAVLICELPGSYVVRHCAGHVADVVRSIALVTPTHQP